MLSSKIKVLDEIKSGKNIYLFYLSAFVCLFELFLGGAPNSPNFKFQIGVFFAFLLLAWSVWKGAFGILFQRDRLLFGALVAVWAVPLLQLIPVPSSIWQVLPGRELEHGILEYLHQGPYWHALTTDFGATSFSVVTLVPPTAIFLSALVLDRTQREALVTLILAVAVVAAFVSFFQFVSAGTSFSFYKTAHQGFGIGFFANRNHQSVFIVIAMLLASGFLIRDARDWQGQLIGLALVMILALSAVTTTFSRAGMAFFLAGLGAVAAVMVGLRNIGWRPMLVALLGLAGLGGAIASTHQFDRFLARLQTAADDQRFEYAVESMPIIGDYFPVGSGIGTFVSVYQKYETIDRLVPNYANHLHNDYLEILMEAGMLGVLALLLGIVALGRLIFRNLRQPFRRANLLGAAAAVSTIFLMAHSVIDYPLRTQALACLFSLLLVLMLDDPLARLERMLGKRPQG
jgi:O-antigen ligase